MNPRSRLALEDVLPDVIIGLVGIPVAFSLQKIAESTLGGDYYSAQLLTQAVVYFSYVLTFYAIFSTTIYLIIELGERKHQHDDRSWQRYLVTRMIFLTPIVFLLVVVIIAIGITFDSQVTTECCHPKVLTCFQCPENLRLILEQSLQPATLGIVGMIGVVLLYFILYASAASPGGQHQRTNILDEFPILLPASFAFYSSAFAIFIWLYLRIL